ncbi:hypothetical protein OTU49_003401 [Cherax quadricarinatus]|uniref:Sodium-dependent nutrient amino acid transporter 1 n=1 Tax=Cherax quadricarinatus TaxID=27406 RepID=A0AAW0XHU9_CHEQU
MVKGSLDLIQDDSSLGKDADRYPVTAIKYTNEEKKSGGGVENPTFEDPSNIEDGPHISKVVGEVEEEEREQWSHPIEFLLSCIAMSVGLGNVWRFPMTAYENGGGAFLIPYLIVLTFIGRPLYFMELALGQFSSYGSVKVWKVVPAVKGVGYGQMIATWSVVTYYCSIMGLTVFYFVMSFNKVLPWSVCDYSSWADDNCVDASSNFTFNNKSRSSSEQYFYNYVLKMADNIDDGIGVPDWRLSLCLLFSWAVLFFTLAKGVQSSGKVAYFTALFPYVVLFTLLGRGVTLPGAEDGILYFIIPQWEKLLDPNLFAVLFFLMLFTLGVGSAAGLTGNIITIICDQFPAIPKIYVTIVICISGFLLGLIYVTPGGQWILDLVDFFGGGFIIYVLIIVETVAINHIYSYSSFLRDLKFMMGVNLGIYWKFCWIFFIPVSLSAILVYSLVDFNLPTFASKAYPQHVDGS